MDNISQKAFLELVTATFNQALFRHDSPVVKGQEAMEQYLANANMTAKEKAAMFSNFLATTTGDTVGRTLPTLVELMKADAALAENKELVAAQVAKIEAETKLLEKQYEIESYRYTNILPQEKALITQQVATEVKNTDRIGNDALLAAANKLLVDAQKTRIDLLTPDESAKLKKEVLLVAEQVTSEIMRNKVDGLLAKQTATALHQGNSFKAHNFQKAADSIAQVMGMIMAADGVPDVSFVQAFAKLIEAGAKVSDPAIAVTFSAVK